MGLQGFCLGGGGEGGSSGRQGGGGFGFLLKIPRGGGVLLGKGGGARGPGGCLQGMWGGGVLNIFFGAEMPAKLRYALHDPVEQ